MQPGKEMEDGLRWAASGHDGSARLTRKVTRSRPALPAAKDFIRRTVILRSAAVNSPAPLVVESAFVGVVSAGLWRLEMRKSPARRLALSLFSSNSTSTRSAWFAAAFTLVFAGAVLWQCDQALRGGEHVTQPQSAATVAKPVPSAEADPAPLFVLFIDSLRYETAMDPALMPAMAALRTESAWARMNTVYQGHTMPAVRALFTGAMSTGVFSIVTDFSHANLRLESVFTDLKASGRSSAAWSSGHFLQFGDALEHRFVHPFLGANEGGDPMLLRDQRRVGEALALFAEGRHALVAAHVEFTDYAAHQFGTHHAEYRRYFAAADALVAKVLKEIPPGVSLAVVGDHGHDERGAHKAGLDIPTLAAFRGPAFRPGFALGTIEITEARYLMHAALRQPINRAAFAHAALDRALVPGAEPPALVSPVALAAVRRLPAGVLVAAVLLAVLGWRLWENASGWGPGLAAVALGALFAPAPLGPWLAAGLALLALFRRMAWREATILTASGAALVLIGTAFVHASATPPIGRGAAAALFAGLALFVGWRPRRERPLWLGACAASVIWILEPWQHATGWLAASHAIGLVVIWLAAFGAWRRAPWSAAAIVLVALWLASVYRRDGGHWAFATPKSFLELVPCAVVAGIAKLLLFCAFAPRSFAGVTVAVLSAGLLGAEQWFVDRSVLGWDERIAATALLVGFGIAWGVARWWRAATWAPLFGIAALFALFYHGVRAQPFDFAWADLLFGGFFLAARLASDDVARAALAAGGVALSYALVQGWLPGGVEWRALYDWIPAQVVETHVLWFLPWILFRETLALWIVRCVFVRATGTTWPAWASGRATAIWLMGLVLVLAGHFAAAPRIETSQIPAEQLAGIGVLMFAALVGAHRAGVEVSSGSKAR